MRYSVLLSLHDREIVDLQKTYKQIAKAVSRRDDIEVVLCYDFAPGAFPLVEQLTEQLAEAFPAGRVIVTRYDTMAEHPETFNLDTHCNPVAVNNHLMDTAKGDNLVWISSDMIVTPLLFDRLDLHIEDDVLQTVYSARVVDQDSGSEFCGPSRPCPFMWCVAHPATGERHDLELLNGFGFDDNDWMARMGIKFGSITIDLCNIAFHQTHGVVDEIGQLCSGKAYSSAAAPGWTASTKYITEKWGGIPFDGKTLDINFGEVGEFLVMNVEGKRESAPQSKRLKAADCVGAKKAKS